MSTVPTLPKTDVLSPAAESLSPSLQGEGGPSFGETLQNALAHVNDLQNKSGELTLAYATGQTSDVHSVMIAGEQASIALQMTAQIRNKVVEAYQEIMKMPM